MIIPNVAAQSVVFVGYQKPNGEFVYCGTAFYYAVEPTEGNSTPIYLVTARHVIDGLQKWGVQKIFVRVNLKDGTSAHYSSAIEEWYTHPTDNTVDVAIIKTGMPENFDHSIIADSMCVTDQLLKEHEISLGDEVFVTGLFRHHHGINRNIPIARVGNLASMLVEHVVTKDFGEIEAYLIECRSIGGLSGSPVFLNLGVIRSIKNQIRFTDKGAPIYLMLGLIHGHYDVKNTEIDTASVDHGLSIDKVNTGIAIVVPFKKIKEVISLYENANIT